MSTNSGDLATAAASAVTNYPSPPAGKGKALKDELIIRSIKLLDIGYVAVIYFSLGLLLAKMMDYYYGKFDPKIEARKTTTRILMEAAGMLWLNGIMIYFVRNIVSLIPFPLNGVYGFDHMKVKELTNATVFVYSYLYFQKTFQDKMRYIYNYLFSKPPTPRPQPVLSKAQLILINKQINEHIKKQRVQDQATIRAIREQAISQALAKALKDAKNAEARRIRVLAELQRVKAAQMAELQRLKAAQTQTTVENK